MNKPLYDQDVVLWSAEQTRALREAGAARLNTPTPIDWDNIAEEIESLGISQRRELHSRLAAILEHMIKLLASAAGEPRGNWMETIVTQRAELERLLESSPSLRREITLAIRTEISRARRTAARKLAVYGEKPLTNLDLLSFTEDQILGDWFPDPHAEQ